MRCHVLSRDSADQHSLRLVIEGASPRTELLLHHFLVLERLAGKGERFRGPETERLLTSLLATSRPRAAGTVAA